MAPGAAGLRQRWRLRAGHRGTQFDPAVVDLFCSRAPELLDGLDRASDWDAVLGTKPELSRRVSGPGLKNYQVLEGNGQPGADMKNHIPRHRRTRVWPSLATRRGA